MTDILKAWPYNNNYGVIRMQLALKQMGINAGIRKITKLMRENGWLHERHRRPYGLTKTSTEIQVLRMLKSAQVQTVLQKQAQRFKNRKIL